MNAVNPPDASAVGSTPSVSAVSSSEPPSARTPSTGSPSHAPKPGNTRDLLKVSLGALGIVYGDIGTSPLYTIRECFTGEHGVLPTPENVLGILSLVFWALLLVVVLKYLTFILRADNNGEGGILSLLALLAPRGSVGKKASKRMVLVLLALFGTALLYGDGAITPVISVFGAVEGLKVRFPAMTHFITPLTAGILVLLFLFQKRGTERVGALFGPVMLIWFASIALIGLWWIIKYPRILWAVNPYYALHFFIQHKMHGFFALSAVVLCITGGEALYADMGHFGRRPIRLAWFAVAFPALLLNYFGQGAYTLSLSHFDKASFSPFFQVVPQALQLPMIGIATAAAIIASQALISGSYSLTRQAVQLGYWPRVSIIHTSGHAEGQIYIPEINWFLLAGCLALVFAFRHEGSSGLAAAYGIAVTGAMSITSILFAVVAYERWGWARWKIGALLTLFLSLDVAFLLANSAKIAAGGWITLTIAAALYALMTTWKAGRAALESFVQSAILPMDLFLCDLDERKVPRVPGTAVFMTSNPDGAPVVLLHHIKHNKLLHEQVVLLAVVTDRVPEVPASRRVAVRELGRGFFQVIAHYGFMQTPNVPDILRCCREAGLHTLDANTSYFLGRETLLTTGSSGLARWRKALFSFLSRNAKTATSFFGIPPNRVVEMGAQIEL
ncbi:MAG: potassium transporter Kup [Myxococcales bacterium]|nr:potassium transporter Kup [Myxococcales bacterium]